MEIDRYLIKVVFLSFGHQKCIRIRVSGIREHRGTQTLREKGQLPTCPAGGIMLKGPAMAFIKKKRQKQNNENQYYRSYF